MTDVSVSAERIARALLRTGAIAVSAEKPFTFASGLKSPIYCDNRLTLSYPEVRQLITEGFQQRVRLHQWRPDVIVGVATAGIPHAAWLAHRLNLPLSYARPVPKEHGKKRQIEGRLLAGQRTLVVEDLVTTGGSSLRAAQAVHAVTGRQAAAVICIFTYGRAAAKDRFENEGVPLHALCDLSVLLKVAEQQALLSAWELAAVRQFFLMQRSA